MLISVVTASYNNVATLGHTLESVAAQDYPRVEHIVVDGASTDGSRELLAARAESAVRWVSEVDRGIYDALNKGIRLAGGEVVGFLHADDEYASAEVLSRVAQCFSDPRVMACYGDLVYVRREDTSRVVRYWQSCPYDHRLLRAGWMPPHPTLYVRRDLYTRIGGFDTSYRIAADYDCMLRLLQEIRQSRGEVRHLAGLMVKMRLGGTSNRSLANILRKSREDLRAMRANRIGGVQTLVRKNVSKLSQFVRRQDPTARH